MILFNNNCSHLNFFNLERLFFNMGQSRPLLVYFYCEAFYNNDLQAEHFLQQLFTNRAFNRHFHIYDKWYLFSGVISAHRRESWRVVTIHLLALQDGEVTIIMQKIVDWIFLGWLFVGSSKLFGLQFWSQNTTVRLLNSKQNRTHRIREQLRIDNGFWSKAKDRLIDLTIIFFNRRVVKIETNVTFSCCLVALGNFGFATFMLPGLELSESNFLHHRKWILRTVLILRNVRSVDLHFEKSGLLWLKSYQRLIISVCLEQATTKFDPLD